MMIHAFITRRNATERGIDKDAPPKRGAALFVDIVRREWWELMKLNLLIVLFCLPVVTIPATLMGATRITAAMVRDENHYLWRDFWDTFRREFVRAGVLGWLLIGAVGVGVAAVVAYARAALETPLMVAPAIVSFLGVSLLILAGSHAATMAVTTGLSTTRILKNAILLAVVWFLPGLAAIVLCASIWLLHIVAYPVSVFIPATFGFSLCALLMTFQSHRALVRHVIRPHDRGERNGDASL